MLDSEQTKATVGVTVVKSPSLSGIDNLWGAMRGIVTIAPEVDLTEPVGEIWDAEQ